MAQTTKPLPACCACWNTHSYFSVRWSRSRRCRADDFGNRQCGRFGRDYRNGFPRKPFDVHENQGYFELAMHQRGLLRPLRPAELSEGTLRYILLAAALLTPRPPSLMVLNEPETGLYPDLLPLAQLIAAASIDTQIVVVSHSAALVSALSEQPNNLHPS